MAGPARSAEATPREEAAHGEATHGIRGGLASLRQRLDAHRSTVVALGCGYLAMVSVAPILTTPYRSDDKVSRGIPDQIHGSGLAAVGSAIDLVATMSEAWIRERGRLFPGTFVWMVAVFDTFQTRLSYKIFIAALVLGMIALIVALVGTLARRTVAPAVVVALTANLTLRNWFDGLDTFTGVLPLTISLTLGCTLMLLRGRSWPSAVAAGLIWSCTLLTYEVAILLTPTLVLTVWAVRRRLRRTLAVVLPALLVAATVLVLRSRAVPGRARTDAYTVNLDPSAVLRTYLRQLFSGLPLAEQWYPGAAGYPGGVALNVPVSLVALMVVLVGVPAAVVLTALARSPAALGWRGGRLAALVGASCWFLPPLLVAVSLGWQNQMPPGEGYVSVVWGYVGVAILMAVGWIAVARRAAHHPTRARRASLHAATGLLAVLCAFTVAQSATIATIAQTHSM